MDKKVLEDKVGRASKALTEICDTPEEILAVITNVTASMLIVFVSPMKAEDAKQYVVNYLVQVSKLVEGALVRGSGKPGGV